MTRSPEARLWHAVVAHALHDAARGRDADWIGSRDFHMVCALAGIEAEAVAENFDADRFRRLIKAA